MPFEPAWKSTIQGLQSTPEQVPIPFRALINGMFLCRSAGDVESGQLDSWVAMWLRRIRTMS